MMSSPLPRAKPRRIKDGPRVLNMPGGVGRFLREGLGIGSSIAEKRSGENVGMGWEKSRKRVKT